MNTEPAVEQHTLSYSEVMEYIIQGKSIPGIKQIPDTVLGLEAGSQAVAPQRRKPWEQPQGQDDKAAERAEPASS